jgi:hypothetical protein
MSINNKLLLQVKLAVAVALSDNEFTDSEIKYIKKWFNNKIIDYPEREKNRLLKGFNNELSTLKELSEFDELDLEDVFYELNDIDDKSFKYEEGFPKLLCIASRAPNKMGWFGFAPKIKFSTENLL